MIKKKLTISIMSLLTAVTLAACNGDDGGTNPAENEEPMDTEMDMDSGDDMGSGEDMDMEGMDHSSSGEVPEGLEAAENPTYEVGSQVIVEADHMAGMQGVEATISGAFDTTVYSISYDPTNGGDPVEDHKWVVHEELENPGEEPLEPGTEVTVNADHMDGMDGANVVIDSAEETTVYMIDYTASTGEEVTNHMWVTESELSAE